MQVDRSVSADRAVAPVGVDLAAPTMEVSHPGLDGRLTTVVEPAGQWRSTPTGMRWQLDRRSATSGWRPGESALGRRGVAVPAWCTITDRWSIRRHLIPDLVPGGRILSSGLAAVLGLLGRGALPRNQQTVVCVDTAVGISASLVAIHPEFVVELLSIGLAPGPDEPAAERSQRWARALRMLAGRASSAEPTPAPVTSAVVLHGDRPRADTDLVVAGLDRAPFWLPVEPLVIDRSGVVAAGAVAAVGGVDDAPAPGDETIRSCAPHAIGVRVVLPDGDEGVRIVVPAGRALPTRVTTRFVSSGGVGRAESAEVLDWVEVDPLDVFAEIDGGPVRPQVRPLCRATGVPGDRTSADAVATGGVLLEVAVDADGLLHLLPRDRWRVDPSESAVIEVAEVEPEPSALALDPRQPAASTGVGWEDVEPEGLSDELLEEVARSEVPRPDLADALLRCEHLLSRDIGCVVTVRSVADLLGVAADADLASQRAAARRLEAAIAVRGVDDPLADAMLAAVRAARRTFSDVSAPTCVGGTAAALEDELRRTVDHLLLLVGEVGVDELQRLVDDARHGGLDEGAVRRVLAERLGRDVVGDGWEPRSAVVMVDPRTGRCALASSPPSPLAVGVRVVVGSERPALV